MLQQIAKTLGTGLIAYGNVLVSTTTASAVTRNAVIATASQHLSTQTAVLILMNVTVIRTLAPKTQLAPTNMADTTVTASIGLATMNQETEVVHRLVRER